MEYIIALLLGIFAVTSIYSFTILVKLNSQLTMWFKLLNTIFRNQLLTDVKFFSELKHLLDYCHDDELHHYEEGDSKDDSHIYLTIKHLYDVLEQIVK